jgi:hypothetical protein
MLEARVGARETAPLQIPTFPHNHATLHNLTTPDTHMKTITAIPVAILAALIMLAYHAVMAFTIGCRKFDKLADNLMEKLL